MSATQQKKMPMRISEQGAVLVSGATIVRDYGDCLLVEVDLDTKYAEYGCDVTGYDCGPSVYLDAGEYSRNTDENSPRDTSTVIDFHEHIGWSVFAKDGPTRCTLRLTLLAPEISNNQPEDAA